MTDIFSAPERLHNGLMKYLVGLSALLSLAAMAHGDDVIWAKDAASAFADAKTKHQLVMIDFDLPGDIYCLKFNDTGLKDPRFVAASKSLVPLKLNASKEGKKLAAQLGVTGYPCVLFVQSDQKVLVRLVGYYSPTEFSDAVQIATELPAGLPAVKALLAKSPNDGEANAKLATYLSATEDPLSGKEPASAPYLAKALSTHYKGPYLIKALIATGAAYSQVEGKQATAIADYKKVLQITKDPGPVSCALAALIYLNFESDKPSAKAYAEQLIALKGATPDWVEVAQNALKDLNGK